MGLKTNAVNFCSFKRQMHAINDKFGLHSAMFHEDRNHLDCGGKSELGLRYCNVLTIQVRVRFTYLQNDMSLYIYIHSWIDS